MITDYAHRGMDLQTYMKYLGINDIAEFRKNFRPQAERAVKVRLALEKLLSLKRSYRIRLISMPSLKSLQSSTIWKQTSLKQ